MKIQIIQNNMSKRPDFKKLTSDEVEYIEDLEKLRDSIEGNGAIDLGIAINSKLKDIAQEIMNQDIQLLSEDDKKYDRFLNTCKIFKDITETMKWFRDNFGQQIKEAEEIGGNALEKMIRKGHK